jgi:hypothetical protein
MDEERAREVARLITDVSLVAIEAARELEPPPDPPLPPGVLSIRGPVRDGNSPRYPHHSQTRQYALKRDTWRRFERAK